VFHGVQANAQRRQSAAVPPNGAVIKWPLFSGALLDFPASVAKQESVQASCGLQLDDDQLSDIFLEKCSLPLLARRLAYLFTMKQIWDFLDVIIEKHCRVLEENLSVLSRHSPLKKGNGLQTRYSDLEPVCDSAEVSSIPPPGDLVGSG
jgi:hypothetical protein